MKTFIGYGSFEVGQRLVRGVSGIAGVELVGHSSRAREAHEIIQLRLPELLILEVDLGEGSGLTLLKVVKALPNPPVVIMLSESTHDQYMRASIRLGADYYFRIAEELPLLVNTIVALVRPLATTSIVEVIDEELRGPVDLSKSILHKPTLPVNSTTQGLLS
jgi:DNA-binding NarL/FixJ family response regulator